MLAISSGAAGSSGTPELPEVHGNLIIGLGYMAFGHILICANIPIILGLFTMRGYSVAIAALALGIEHKWLDNLLSQHRVQGVTQSRQGVQRRLPPAALTVIATVYHLNRELRVPVATALQLAHGLWGAPAGSDSSDVATVQAGELELRLSRAAVRDRIAAAVAEALEVAPRTKRGRPPGDTARRRGL